MKMITLAFAALAIVGFSQVSSAADVSSCRNEVYKSCSRRVGSALSSTMYSARECKFVSADGITNVAFIGAGGRSLTSVDTSDCGVASYTFSSGVVKDQGVLEGRLFVSLSSNRVVMLGRNNYIYEIKNAEGQPYSSVTGIRIDQQARTLVLQRGNQETPLTMEQIQNRIDSHKIEALAASR